MERIHFRMNQGDFLFARARARIYSSAASAALVLFFCNVISAFPAFALEPRFIRDGKGAIQTIALEPASEKATRVKLGVNEDCVQIKKTATAKPLMVSRGAMLIPHLSSHRGLVVVEGLLADQTRLHLETHLMGGYRNLPASLGMAKKIKGDQAHFPLLLTFAATMVGDGDWAIAAGDYITVKTDDQLYSYYLPVLKIPSEGILQLYAGTDDRLYYDAALMHPLHSGACRSDKK